MPYTLNKSETHKIILLCDYILDDDKMTADVCEFLNLNICDLEILQLKLKLNIKLNKSEQDCNEHTTGKPLIYLKMQAL